MHLEIQRDELIYVMSIIKAFKSKCKVKAPVVYIIFSLTETQFVFSAESFFVKYRYDVDNEFKGEFTVPLNFLENVCNLFTGDELIEIDFEDKIIISRQGGTTLKGQTAGRCVYDRLNVDVKQLEEIPLQIDISNKLLNLSLDVVGTAIHDPYAHLYNINQFHLIKMSSFCALMQVLPKESNCNVTLTQDILSICSLMRDDVTYYKYGNSFYIKSENIEARIPLANIRFPNLQPLISNTENGGQVFLLKSSLMLDICNKCCNLNIPNKIDRINIVFKDGLMMYDYNGVLTGSVESGLTLDWKAAINPLLMRGILRYINSEVVMVCKKDNCGNILIYNEDKSITFMLALCK
jgi:DNA polymerase III sliding clamp (beta) subunit (PCNA family)